MFTFNSFKKLKRAIAKNDIETARSILASKKGLINQRDPADKMPPLHKAIRNKDMMIMLIEMGADVEMTDGKGTSILTRAVYWHDSAELMQILTGKLAGKHPLLIEKAFFIALGNKHYDTAMALLQAGVAPDAVEEESGRTALTFAIRAQNTDIVKELLKRGAKVDGRGAKEMTPLMHAAQSSNVEVVDLLLSHNAAVNLKDVDGRTALCMLYNGKSRIEIATKLLERGADIHSVDGDNRHILQRLTVHGYPHDFLDFVLARGIDIDNKDIHGDTALMVALKEGAEKTAQMLIDAGANLELQDADSNDMLMLAITGKCNNIAQNLLEQNLYDLNAENIDGNTAFKLAKQHGRENLQKEIKKRLIAPVFLAPKNGSAWVRSGDAVAHITAYPELQHNITTIFNFVTREKFAISENTLTKNEGLSSAVSFDTLGEVELRRALDAFREHGGDANEDYVFNGKNAAKKSIPSPKQ